MKVFETKYSTNVVDENNVFVGFETDQQCCEYVEMYFSENPFDQGKHRKHRIEISEVGNEHYLGYVFDVDYVGELTDTSLPNEDQCTEVFKLVKEGCNDLYLVLSNTHNGYYSHGFTLSKGYETNEQVIRSGEL